jgi:uncharacterized protein (TIGR00299 family) protein
VLGVERCTSRSVVTGSGTVKCEHGLMPVPAPATAELLRGAPLAPSSIRSELTTPTGAAILAETVRQWTESPVMMVEAIGHGAGMKDFLEQPNVLRIFVGQTADANPAERDQVWLLETNLDDVPGEVVGFAVEQLFAAGALDVFTTAIQMKKHRPGVLLSVIAPLAGREALETILFRETATLGVRRVLMDRTKLQRDSVTVETPWGPVRGKRAWREGLEVFAPEYEDCARVARTAGVALREVYQVVRRAHEKGSPP